jgi:PHP family Zn ribbon phosphoesterase
MDHEDKVLGVEENLLINATDIPFEDVFKLVESYGGVAFPAHVEKSSYSLLSNLGFVPPESNFTVAEFKNLSKAEEVLEKHPYFKECKLITNSDAHYLEQINTNVNFLQIEELSAHAIIDALRNRK